MKKIILCAVTLFNIAYSMQQNPQTEAAQPAAQQAPVVAPVVVEPASLTAGTTQASFEQSIQRNLQLSAQQAAQLAQSFNLTSGQGVALQAIVRNAQQLEQIAQNSQNRDAQALAHAQINALEQTVNNDAPVVQGAAVRRLFQ